VGATLRFSQEDPLGVIDQETHPVIYSFWHHCLAASPLWYARELRPRGLRMAGLISASGDGEVLAAAMGVFGIDAVRGSRSRGGTEALRELLHALERGSDVAVTPDGPRGPRHVLQPGLLQLAKLSGRPIVPVRFIMRPVWRMKTWDRFEFPLPFGRCHLEVHPPVRVERYADEMEFAEVLAKAMGE
jgi:lysophospholipid acyltransferase (LPLAT)-like uncharacterized protein